MAKRLLLLNGVAILGVILFHASGFGFMAMFAWPHRYRDVVSPNYQEAGTSAYYALRAMEQFVAFCIPAFLFVSGFFVSVLAGRTRATVGPRAIAARIRALLVPYLFWSTVVLIGLLLQGRVVTADRFVRWYATGAISPNYYFVPLLVQLYVVAPVLVLLARWRWKVLLGATAVLQLAVYAVQYPLVLGLDSPALAAVGAALPKWFFVVHLFWFTFGVVAGFKQQVLKSVLERGKWVLLAALIGLFVLGILEWELLLRWSGSPWRENRMTIVDGFYAAMLILSFLAFADVELPASRLLLALGARSYGIYLVHGIVMEYFSRGLYHFAPWVLGRQALFQPMLIVLGLAVPLVLMAVVNRSPSRTLYGYVFG